MVNYCGIDRKTVAKWNSMILEIVSYHESKNKNKIGELNNNRNSKIVKLDECLFFKIKFKGDRQ